MPLGPARTPTRPRWRRTPSGEEPCHAAPRGHGPARRSAGHRRPEEPVRGRPEGRLAHVGSRDKACGKDKRRGCWSARPIGDPWARASSRSWRVSWRRQPAGSRSPPARVQRPAGAELADCGKPGAREQRRVVQRDRCAPGHAIPGEDARDRRPRWPARGDARGGRLRTSAVVSAVHGHGDSPSAGTARRPPHGARSTAPVSSATRSRRRPTSRSNDPRVPTTRGARLDLYGEPTPGDLGGQCATTNGLHARSRQPACPVVPCTLCNLSYLDSDSPTRSPPTPSPV